MHSYWTFANCSIVPMATMEYLGATAWLWCLDWDYFSPGKVPSMSLFRQAIWFPIASQNSIGFLHIWFSNKFFVNPQFGRNETKRLLPLITMPKWHILCNKLFQCICRHNSVWCVVISLHSRSHGTNPLVEKTFQDTEKQKPNCIPAIRATWCAPFC